MPFQDLQQLQQQLGRQKGIWEFYNGENNAVGKLDC